MHNYSLINSIELLIANFRDLKNIHVCEEISFVKSQIIEDNGNKYEDFIKEIKFKIFRYNDRFVFENYKLLYEATIKETFSENYLEGIHKDLDNIFKKIISE